MGTDPVLDARGLVCGYAAEDVLAGVSVRLAAGEFVAVAGPNGSGKSTLVRALSRVLRPRAGEVRLDGRDLFSLPARACARAVAVVPQETPFDFAFTVGEVVLMGRAPHLGRFASEGPADRAAADEAMERTGTAALRDRSILEISGGERQRVVLARALAQEPRVLLLDEPTAHLDLAYQASILRTVDALRRDRGTAVLATVHDLNLAAGRADRIVLLAGGRVVADGPPAAVLVEDRLREVYGTDLRVRPHPENGTPYVYLGDG